MIFGVMKTKLVLNGAVLIGALALISAGYCFWLITTPFSYDWVPVVLIGFVVAIGVLVISWVTLFIVFVRLRRSPCALDAPRSVRTSNQAAQAH
jgi:hypothetical protein